MMKQRLDVLLVRRGLADSREKAQALIMAGNVSVAGQKALKPGQTVDAETALDVASPPRYVSRGGLKLEHALRYFGIDTGGRVCLDIGASTGGFTDCLLQHGAARVYAFDVGTNQLDWRIRSDPRVSVREQFNARAISLADTGELVDLLVCDVSFISVTLILPAAIPLLQPSGQMVILVKPQFEAGRGQVGKGGIVRDPEVHEEACRRVTEAVQAQGFRTSLTPSPILGAEGNREFLLHARR